MSMAYTDFASLNWSATRCQVKSGGSAKAGEASRSPAIIINGTHSFFISLSLRYQCSSWGLNPHKPQLKNALKLPRSS
jgi:hypothetical protein